MYSVNSIIQLAKLKGDSAIAGFTEHRMEYLTSRVYKFVTGNTRASYFITSGKNMVHSGDASLEFSVFRFEYSSFQIVLSSKFNSIESLGKAKILAIEKAQTGW